MNHEMRELDCDEMERFMKDFPDEMAVILEMLRDLEVPCFELAA